MPTNWTKGSKKKEKAWNKAKKIFKKQYGREPDGNRDYAIVMKIAKNHLNEEFFLNIKKDFRNDI